MDREMDLVDVVVILSRQWVVFGAVFIICLVVGILYTSSQPVAYRYSALYELPARQYDNGEVLPWVEADEVAENIETATIHPLISTMVEGEDERQEVSLWFSTDGRGRTIEIMADVSESNAEQAVGIEGKALELLEQDQAAQFEDRVKEFDDSISKMNTRIAEVNAMHDDDSRGDKRSMRELAVDLERVKEELLIERQKLLPGRVVMLPTRSLNPVGMGPALKLAVVIIISLLIAFVASMLAEVSARARQRISATNG
jgi:hypothetical protein